jgi:hypothetical protein
MAMCPFRCGNPDRAKVQEEGIVKPDGGNGEKAGNPWLSKGLEMQLAALRVWLCPVRGLSMDGGIKVVKCRVRGAKRREKRKQTQSMTTSRAKVLTRIDIKAFMRSMCPVREVQGRKRLRVKSCGLLGHLAMAVAVPVRVPVVALRL